MFSEHANNNPGLFLSKTNNRTPIARLGKGKVTPLQEQCVPEGG